MFSKTLVLLKNLIFSLSKGLKVPDIVHSYLGGVVLQLLEDLLPNQLTDGATLENRNCVKSCVAGCLCQFDLVSKKRQISSISLSNFNKTISVVSHVNQCR